ncbi:hypothetical protein [Pseudomonas alkylphenolica]|uniref:hypothetical protein n=1 Tax=Pseudomonas alkylphenolica TaxID=237609 RepID=UPI000FEC0DD9|nr:hypothetical protein [Pseudomonas alkylphenolica]
MSTNEIARVQFNIGCAISTDMYYMSCAFVHSSETDSYSRMYFYQDKTPGKWFYHDLPGWNVISTAFPPGQPVSTRKVYALSEEGDVECFGRDITTYEKIADAGVSKSSKLYGYVNKISFIFDTLYVCGHRGQVYKRTPEGWVHFDEGLLQDEITITPGAPGDFMEQVSQLIETTISLFDINGVQNDIYTVGANGFIAHQNGSAWSVLPKQTVADLHAINVHRGDVLVVGARATILYGNASAGFRVLGGHAVDVDFYSVALFNDTYYIGASDGVYTLSRNVLAKVNIEAKEVTGVESIDGVIWALASDKLLRFSEGGWEVFTHIDN